MLNSWSGQGRLTKDIELKYTAQNIPVATFTLAVDRDYRPKDGERQADFVDVVAWRSGAEFVSKYFKKGDMMIVNGRIQTRMFEDKNGNKRKAVEVLGESFNFGSNRRNDKQSEQQTYEEPINDMQETFEPVIDDIPEDMPF